MNINENYTTSDFCLASTLVSQRFTVSGLDKSNPKRIGFNFQDSEELQKTVSDFWAKKLLVSPFDFYYAQRQLKTLMYQN